LYLDQNDTTKPFIVYVGATGAGSAINISTDSTPGTGSLTPWIQIEVNGARYWLQTRSDA